MFPNRFQRGTLTEFQKLRSWFAQIQQPTERNWNLVHYITKISQNSTLRDS